MEAKSIEEIVRIIDSKIKMMLIEQLPTPSCPRKRDQNNWKIDQIKKALINKLHN